MPAQLFSTLDESQQALTRCVSFGVEGLDFWGREVDPCIVLGSAIARLNESCAWKTFIVLQAA